MGSHGADAPPPPGRRFAYFLVGVALVTLILIHFAIKPAVTAISGNEYAYLFTLGYICFLAPLLGWAIQITVGRHTRRQGDWLPVSALLISFCCALSIFHRVVVQDYHPSFAIEHRFNWINVAGDGALTADGGARQLGDAEYASDVGAAKIVAAAKRAYDPAQMHKLTAAHAQEIVNGVYYFVDPPIDAPVAQRYDVPSLTSFDVRAADAAAQFMALPVEMRAEVYFWLVKARLQQLVARHGANDAEGDPETNLTAYDLSVLSDARADLARRANANASLYEHSVAKLSDDEVSSGKDMLEASSKSIGSLDETLVALGLSLDAGGADAAHAHADDAHAADHDGNADHSDEHAGNAEGSEATHAAADAFQAPSPAAVQAALVAFADAEQALIDFRVYTFLDSKHPEHVAGRTNLRAAANDGFQFFAVGILIDNVTAIVLLMVCFLAFMIHLFSIGYMAGDVRYARFFATINLFTAGMIGLVLASNFLWLFVCWEIMGLCSYLLIGHYFEKKSAQEASMKAFFTTRIADTFMFLGMMMIFTATGTLVFAGGEAVTLAMQTVGSYMGPVDYAGPGSMFDLVGGNWLLLGGLGATTIGFLCFLGPAGKSAQFPFHVWLPDAMEGPTPVSAMIHAACMVSAGVYLTARLFPLFPPDVLEIIAIIGGFTALAAGTIGLVQTDLKKVLAYSTISQLGYMFLGIGVGAWYPALFHMLTHAFFKALMFLGSGSVILGCHHEQEMTKMGGLRKKMPITALTFWIGTLSIIGMPYFFAGFYSKEAILTDSMLFGSSGGTMLPYIFGALGAGLTTFYMLRLMWMTFHGKPRDKGIYDHCKESPWTVLVPLVSIAFFALIVAWPIGAAPKIDPMGGNMGIATLGQNKLAGSDQASSAGLRGSEVRPAQMPSESNLAYLMRKPASAYPESFIKWEYPVSSVENADGRNVADTLYADKHGRKQYRQTFVDEQGNVFIGSLPGSVVEGGAQAFRIHDRIYVNPDSIYGDHGHGGHGDEHGAGHDEHASRDVPNALIAADEMHAEHDDAAAHGGDHGDHAAHGTLDVYTSHLVHAFHELHHSKHVLAFIGSLIALMIGWVLSLYLYMGPLSGRDWVGHSGLRFRTKIVLQNAYYMDDFYFGTVLRGNRWLRQVCAWFDRTVVDGVVNSFGGITVWMCGVAAKIDHWGVDGSVRGVGNATFWTSRQAQRTVTGRIQDYVFLLVSAVVVLFLFLVLM